MAAIVTHVRQKAATLPLRLAAAALLLLMLALPSAAPALAESCAAQSGPAIGDPDAIDGVRTKWKTLRRDKRNTIQPDLAGLTVEQWVKSLQSIGANMLEINLEARRLLAAKPDVGDEVWKRYIDHTLRGGAAESDVAGIEATTIAKNRFTVAQRNAVLLSFLQELEDLRLEGAIDQTFTFLIHQRQWFNGKGKKGERRRTDRAPLFVTDMSEFINSARERCLDHWLAGVRLGEHAVTEMSVLMPLAEELARGINGKTDGWLKSKLFLLNGGGWGVEYTDFDLDFKSFFQSISKQTGAFAIGYKFMQFNGRRGLGYIKQRMQRATCGKDKCDRTSVEDWIAYLDDLGFARLRTIIDEYKDAFPCHANVMFVGDSSDAVATIFEDGNSPEIEAIRKLLPDGPGWQGKLFMNAFTDTMDTRSKRARGKGTDVGWALFFVRDGKPELQPKAAELWRQW